MHARQCTHVQGAAVFPTCRDSVVVGHQLRGSCFLALALPSAQRGPRTNCNVDLDIRRAKGTKVATPDLQSTTPTSTEDYVQNLV